MSRFLIVRPRNTVPMPEQSTRYEALFSRSLKLLIFGLYIVQGKLQKHQAFEAEVAANEDRIFSAINMGKSKSSCDRRMICALLY